MRTPSTATIVVFACVTTCVVSGAHAQPVPIINEAQKLLASDGAASDKFGFAVQREGDLLVIGAPQHYTNALPGSFYVFERDGGSGTWIMQERIFSGYQPGQAEFGDVFGEALALNGDTLLVGAPFAELDGATLVGQVQVFERQPDGTWVRQQTLLAGDDAAGTRFGSEIVMVGDTAVISDLFGAYVFTRDGSGTWSQQDHVERLEIDNVRSLAFDGQRIGLTSYEFPTDGPQAVVLTSGPQAWNVSDPLTCSAQGFLTTGGAWFCGDQLVMGISDLNGPDYAFLFESDGAGSWSEIGVLTNPDTADPYPHTHGFGNAMRGDGSAMIIGAQHGNRAYVYQRAPADDWTFVAQLRPTDAYELAQNFGNEVNLVDGIPVVGSWAHHENGLYAGAVYVFDEIPMSIDGDVTGDGIVNVDDLLEVIIQWGDCTDCPATPCTADLDGNCVVTVDDLVIVLSSWG